MGILLGHEMGHYLTCRYYGVRATLPVFLPLPFPPFGTLGAVIMMRSPMPNRRAIFDIGVAGPLVGLALSLPAIIIGLHMSQIMNDMALLHYYAAHKHWIFFLGAPEIFKWIQSWMVGPIPEGMTLDFHPLAFAGWVGLFVTALNLLPVGQLDGGHILYALFGRRSVRISQVVVGLALLVAVAVFVIYQFVWEYTLFIVLVFLLSYRFPHPPPLDDFDPIGPTRMGVAVLTLAMLILSFTPRPVPQVFSSHMLKHYIEDLQEQEDEEERDWSPEDVLRWTRKV
jgi:membrane-associated protease RseP (regulator of RpoE activity)